MFCKFHFGIKTIKYGIFLERYFKTNINTIDIGLSK